MPKLVLIAIEINITHNLAATHISSKGETIKVDGIKQELNIKLPEGALTLPSWLYSNL